MKLIGDECENEFCRYPRLLKNSKNMEFTCVVCENKNLESCLEKTLVALESVVNAARKPQDLHNYHEINFKALHRARITIKEIKTMREDND